MLKAKFRVQTQGSFLILLALMLLLLPLQWVLAAALAASVHECCHYLAIRLLGGRVYGLRLGMNGAKLELEPLPPVKELIASLAGPFGSALLLFAAKWVPRTAVCAFFHCACNLLPLFPLDGGRALRSALCAIFPQGRAERMFSASQRGIAVVLGIFCALLALRGGVLPAVAMLLLILRQIRRRNI